MTDLINLCKTPDVTLSEVLDCILKNKDTKNYINAKNNDGETALMWASYNGHLEVVKLLVTLGADVNAKDKNGNTALMWAIYNGHSEVVAYLKSLNKDTFLMYEGKKYKLVEEN